MIPILLKLTFGVFVYAGSFPHPLVPDETTPGHLCDEYDPDFTEYRYREEIPYCARDVSVSEKRKIYEEYGVPERCRNEYTIDHYYPLSLGGSNARENLWPEHRAIKRSRQNLETRLFVQMRDGQITQKKALREIHKFKQNPDIRRIPATGYCDPVNFFEPPVDPL